MKPAVTVMAGLVPAIRSGSVPRLMAGTGPAMTMKVTPKANRVSLLGPQRRGNPGRSAQLDRDLLRSARNDRKPDGHSAWRWMVAASDAPSARSATISSLLSMAASRGGSTITSATNSTAATTCARFTVAIVAPGTGAPR